MGKMADTFKRIDELDEMAMSAQYAHLGTIHAVHPEYDINTREEWLQVAATIMQPWLDMAVEAENEVRRIRINNDVETEPIELLHPPLGFDIAVAPVSPKALGTCRRSEFAENRARITISPKLTGDEFKNRYNLKFGNDAVYLVHVLLHEMVHAYTEGHGHRGYFKAIMKRLNSIGKMTATHPGELQAHLISTRVLPFLPRYNELHVPFDVTPRGKRGKGSRLVKLETDCGLILRASRTVADQIIPGICPCLHCPQDCEIREAF